MVMINPQKTRGIYLWVNYQVPKKVYTGPAQTLYEQIIEEQNTLDAGMAGGLPLIPSYIVTLTNDIKSKQSQLDALTNSGNGMITTMVNKASSPVVLGGVTSLGLTWTNDIGKKQGLSANFLQPWFNKPVEIAIEGMSYMGAWGGTTVSGSINEAIQANSTQNPLSAALNAVKGVATSVGNPLNAAQTYVETQINTITTALNTSAYQTIGPVQDQTIAGLQKLISFFPYGPTTSPNKSASNIAFELLIENEPTGSATDQYAVFEGFIEKFHYKESVDNPYLYNYTIDFVGQSKQDAQIGSQQINAQLELSSMAVTTAVSASGQTITLFSFGS